MDASSSEGVSSKQSHDCKKCGGVIMKSFNAVNFIGSGFEYTLRGTESGGYYVNTCLSKRKQWYPTLEAAHAAINHAFKVYKKNAA